MIKNCLICHYLNIELKIKFGFAFNSIAAAERMIPVIFGNCFGKFSVHSKMVAPPIDSLKN